MEPHVIQSGYLLHGFPTLKDVPSEYAFNQGPTSQRIPSQTLSQYQLPVLNSWRTATSNPAYNYVKGDEVPRPTQDEQVIKGNIISMKSFRERLSTYDDGFYQPAMINGALYFVHCEGTTHTAREAVSATNVNTAVQAESLHTALEDDCDVHTARLYQSPHVKASVTDVRLTFHQLRRLLGRELFRDVIKKYKKELKIGKMSASGTDIREEEDEVVTAKSPTAQSPRTLRLKSAARSPADGQLSLKTAHSRSFHDRLESNISTAISPCSPSLALRTAESMTNVHRDRPESNVGTAIEPLTSEIDNTHIFGSAASTPTNQSSCLPTSNVVTALEITESTRAHLEQQLKQQSGIGFLQPDPQRSVTEIQGPHHRFGQTPQSFDGRAASSAKNLGNAPTQSQLTPADTSVKTALENPSETNIQTALSNSSTMAI